MAEGEVFADRFEIRSWVGAGSAGDVYRAIDRTTGADVAVKILHATGAGFAPRLAREAEALASLLHPAIVRYVDHGISGSKPYLAMEWIEGSDLAARVRAGPLAVGDAVAAASRIAAALGVAHARGFLHRDIKPSNVLLRGGDPRQAVLADFGIARLIHGAELTAPGTILGTAAYMAPEQARAVPELDARADVFAIGALLHHALTGRPPFEGDEIVAVLTKVLFHDPPALDELRPDVPRELAALCSTLLSKDPAARPRDGDEVARLLGAIDLSTPPAVPARPWVDRRFHAVVIALELGEGGDAAPVSRRVDRRRLAALAEALAPFGATVAPLADGSIAALLAEGPATDLALAAARAALVLGRAMPGARVSIASGLDALDGARCGGEIIDRAALLVRAIEAGDGIRVDASTAALLAGRFRILGEAEGLLLGAEIDRIRGESLMGKPTPFVGREREVATLQSLVEESAREDVVRVAIVLAGAGSGKTRLLSEVVRAQAAAHPDRAIWIGRGEVEHAGAPLAVAAQLVLSAAASGRGDPVEVRRTKLRSLVERGVAPASEARVAEFLAEIVGAGPAVESAGLFAARLDPMLMAAQVARAFEELLAAELALRPVLLVLEDLHDVDVASLQLIEEACKRLRDRPLAILAVARPHAKERLPDAFRAFEPLELRLNALTPRSSQRLVRACLGDDVDDATVIGIASRAAGHPFVLEELVRATSEGRGDAVPDSVIAVVQSRLDALPPEARRLLRAASIYGETSWVGGHRAIMPDISASAAEAWTTSLVDRELLERQPTSRVAGEHEVRFRHALLREAAYATWSPSDRALAHRLAGDWLEAIGETDAASLVLHFERSGQTDRARAALGRAAEQALRARDLDGAVERSRRAAEGAHGPELARLLTIEAQALTWRGERGPAAGPCLSAFEEAAVGDASFFQAGALAFDLLLADPDSSRVAAIAERVFRASQAAPARDHAARHARFVALSRMVRWALYTGRPALAEDVMSHLEGEVDAGDDHALAARVCMARAEIAQFRGRLDELKDHVTEHLAHAEAIGDQRQICTQRLTLGYALLTLGRHREAEGDLEAARAIAEGLGMVDLVANAWQNLGISFMHRGDHDRAEAAERTSLRLYTEQGDAFMGASSRKYLAEVLLAAGRNEEAVVEASAAAASMQGTPVASASAQAVLARALLRLGRAEEAARHAASAALLLDEECVDEGEATIRLASVETLEALGRLGEAELALRAGVARLEEVLGRLRDEASQVAFAAIPEHAALLARARRTPGPV